MQIHSIFPTPVGVFDMGRTFTDAELAFIDGLDQQSNIGNKYSVDTHVLAHPAMADVRSFVEASFETYFRTVYAPPDGVTLHLTQSWANYTQKGGFHHRHTHSNSVVSGALYVRAVENVDNIWFYKDGYQALDIPATTTTAWNSTDSGFGVKEGMLVLFPSSLQHMVPPTQSDSTRVSVAINAFVRGSIGYPTGLTELNLYVATD